jgi:hypothetical protein
MSPHWHPPAMWHVHVCIHVRHMHVFLFSESIV